MKNAQKIFLALLCGLMATLLCACGDKDNTPSEPSSDAATVTVSSGTQSTTEQSGDIDLGGIILPEEGKITFGKDNKSENAATDNGSSAKSGEKNTGTGVGSNANATAGGNSSESQKPSGETSSKSTTTEGYGGIQWNK